MHYRVLRCQMSFFDASRVLTQSQRDRLAYVDLCLRFLGVAGRQDVARRFGIKTAAASRDLATYRELAPVNLTYDTRSKVYLRAEGFRGLFTFPERRVLEWLAYGYGDEEPLQSRGPLVHEAVRMPAKIDLDLVSVLTRAIHGGTAVEVSYRSLSTGFSTRQIVPFALCDDGLRWHLRAFCRRTQAFRDFVLTRFVDARFVQGDIAEHERKDADIQWNRITELELVPHPVNVLHPDTIEAEYSMVGGVLRIPARAAMVGYLLRRWNVDCTPNHRLRGAGFQLWLRNRPALYAVTNLELAPGYADDVTAEEVEPRSFR